MKEIALTKGLVAVVDDEDYEMLSAHSWHLYGWGYAARHVKKQCGDLRKKRVLMHRAILGLPDEDARVVDHINGNRLDNRRSNLRICTAAENLRNRRASRNNTSGYKGVSWHIGAQKWQAKIMVSYKRKHLGYFDSPEEAHKAYSAAASLLHGEFANHG